MIWPKSTGSDPDFPGIKYRVLLAIHNIPTPVVHSSLTSRQSRRHANSHATGGHDYHVHGEVHGVKEMACSFHT
jgi:hypothetical protein